MNCTITWNELDLKTWQDHFSNVRRSTLLQSYDYARAMAPIHGQRPQWGVIQFNGQDAGLLQIMEARLLFGALHGVICDRGPLWFDGFGSAAHWQGFLQTFALEFPPRFGRKRRLILETPEGGAIKTMLEQFGFLPNKKSAGYQTVWINLVQNDEALRARLRKNWRNTLSRAERQNLSIEWDNTGLLFPWIMSEYTHDKTVRDYHGASPKTLRALAGAHIPEGKMLIGRIMNDNTPIAGALFFLHGSSATYQIGWTNDGGRKTGAQNLLLWNALGALRNHDIKDLDLGGCNDDTAKGVKDFKMGMGGDLVHLCGVYN